MQIAITKKLLFTTAAIIALICPLSAHAQVTKKLTKTFEATLTSFQTSVGPGVGNYHFIQATVHFQNTTKLPIILGSDKSAFSATDEQGNRYGVSLVRGMGEGVKGNLDPKFVLAPGAGSDMFVELFWRGSKNQVFGVTFDMSLAVRDLKPLAGNQYELGPETPFEFTGLKTGYVAAPEGTEKAQPFTAEIIHAKFAPTGRWQMVGDMTMKIENTSDKPLILACEKNSIFGGDNEGNLYGRGSASSTDVSVVGIGLVSDSAADPQFVLAPGESKEIRFTLKRAEKMTIGTEFTFYVALEALEILPSKQIHEVRQYAVTIPKIKM